MSRYRVAYAAVRDIDGTPPQHMPRCPWALSMTIYLTGDDMKEIEPTPWFELAAHTPIREGWYEVQLTSGDTAFAKFGDGVWTEKPLLVFTHWRGLSADPSTGDDAEGVAGSASAEATAAQGVRAAWNAFFPGLGEEQHKPLDALPNGKAPH